MMNASINAVGFAFQKCKNHVACPAISRRMWRVWLVGWLMLGALPVYAATTHTWTGGGSSANWNDASNWTDGLPSNGDSLVFPADAARKTNNNDFLTSVGTVNFLGGGYTISGNNLTLGGAMGNLGANTWAINLTLAASRTITSEAGTDGGTLTVSGNISLGSSGSVVLSANHTTGNDGNITVSGIISGSGTNVVVTKGGSGAGTVILTRANTYAGKTLISSGFLSVSSDGNLGAVPGSIVSDKIQLGGGYLLATSSFTLNAKRGAKITVAGATTGFWTETTGVTLTYGGVISAAGSLSHDLSLDGEGTIELSGASTYGGKTKVIVDTARISNKAAFGKSALSGGDRVEVNALSTVELTGNISVPKAMILDKAKLVSVSGDNTWEGVVVIGINDTGKSVIRSEAGATLTLYNITVDTDTLTDPVNTYQNLFLEGDGDISIAGEIAGDGTDGAGSYLLGHGDVVMDGSGTLTLSGANTYSGRTIVNSGIVAVSSDDNLGTVPDSATAGRIVINGGTLEAMADFTLADTRGIALGPTTGSGSGTIQIDSGYTVDYAGIIADNDGSSDFYKTGDGTLILAGDSTYAGVTTIDGGTLQIGNGGTTGSINVNSEIIDNATLVFNQSDTVTQGTEFNSLISGTGGVSQNGSDVLILNGANVYEGPTAVNSGVLMVVNTSGSGTGSGAVTVYDTATLAGDGTIAGSVNAQSGSRVEPGTTPGSVDTLNIGGAVTFEAGSTYECDIGGGTTCDKLNMMGTGSLTLDPDSVLDITGEVTGDGRTLAINIVRNGNTGLFNDTAAPGNLLEDTSLLHLAPNEEYHIYYVNKTASDDGYIVLKLEPNAAGAVILAYETPNGVVVEFQTIEEAGQNDIILYLSRDGQWVEVGRQPATGEGSHTYRFLVPGLKAGDSIDLFVSDDERRVHNATGLLVSSFTTQNTQIAQTDASGMTLQWESTPGRLYDIYRAAQLGGIWEYVQTVEASTTLTAAFIAFDPDQPSAFFKIGVR